MSNNKRNESDMACEPSPALMYGMSSALRESDLLGRVRQLSHNDRVCLIRYIHEIDDSEDEPMSDFYDDAEPYTMEELNGRIDEAEEEISRGEGKHFSEMEADLKKELLWLK